MITVTEFKTRQKLSDSQFKRVRALAEKNVGQAVTTRVGASTWQVTDETALMNALAEYNGGVLLNTFRPVPDPLTESINCEIIPHSSIQVLNADQCSELDRIAAMAESMQVYKPQQIELNGSQNEILSMLTVVASTVQNIEQTNLERKTALDERRQKLATAQNVLSHLATVGKGLEAQSAAINDDAKDVVTVESDVKKQLAALLASLS